jgi:hypothetical protein
LIDVEHVGGDAREVCGLAILVVAFGTPVCRTVDDLFVAPSVYHLEFVVRYAVGMQAGENFSIAAGPEAT